MKNNKTMHCLFFLVYAFGALSTTQTIPFLKQNGFHDMQQGWILASIALFTIVLQIIFGIASDRTGKMKPFFIVLFLVSASLSVWLYLKTWKDFWIMFLFVGFIGGGCRCYQSMVDTWVLELKDKKNQFEKDKAFGSLGWAIGAWAAALICSFFSFQLLAWMSLFTGTAALVISFFCRDGQRDSTIQFSLLKDLIRNKEYLLLILLMLVLFSMGCADIYLVVDKIISLGGNSFHIGLKWGIQSLAEAPVFFLAEKLITRFKMIPLLLFSTVMFGIRFLIYGLLQEVWWIVAAALLQSVTFPVAIYCTKVGIDQCTDQRMKSTAQLAGASIYMGISLLVMPVLCSGLSQMFSKDIALFCVASFSFLALGLIMAYKKVIS